LKHPYFKDLRDQDLALSTAGPQGFGNSISKNNLIENVSQYSGRNSENVSDHGSSITGFNNSISGAEKITKGKVNFPNGSELANGSFYNKSVQKNLKPIANSSSPV